MFLLQSGIPVYVWAIIGTVGGIIALIFFSILGFTIWFWSKNWKRVKRDSRNVEKIIARLAGDEEEFED